MKSRASTLLTIFGGLAAAACFVALVLGLTNLLARNTGTQPGLAQGPRGDMNAGAFGGARPVAPIFDMPPPDVDFDFVEGDVAMGGFPGGAGIDFARPAGIGDQPVVADDVKALRGPALAAAEHKISGPFTQGQLSVFLVHGKGVDAAKDAITLQEALGRGVATVHEGGISIDNRSGVPIFVQGGDVIKGGTQDRVLPYDYLIPAGATRFPVQAFCVEAGRSFPRAGEISTSFAVSSDRLPTKELRLAAFRRNQAGVWAGVARLQDNLSRSIGDVRAPLSRTSLQLTLEHPRVQNGAQEFLDTLLRAPDKSDDVLGMVVAVNGRLVSADIYSSPELFQKFWPKLMKAAAVEAMVEGSRSTTPVSEDVVRAFLSSADSGSAFRQTTGGASHMLRREGTSTLAFDTCHADTVVHRALLAR